MASREEPGSQHLFALDYFHWPLWFHLHAPVAPFFGSTAAASTMTTTSRTYKSALELLHQLRRGGRPTAKSQWSIAPQSPNQNTDLRGTPSIVGMKQWLQQLGHSPDQIDALNVIHVAGTKGKGSTCAFIESLLRSHGVRTGFPAKTGLYTSPHLVHLEERTRINFDPLPRDKFAQYVWQVHDKLFVDPDRVSRTQREPRFLQFMLLVSFHAFLSENVDVAILETHHGGEFDSTNVVERPLVTVVTPLGMDHVAQLGPTINDIAWHKAGIFKRSALAISPKQTPSAAKVLESRAQEKSAVLRFVEVDTCTQAAEIEPEAQRINATVAIAASKAFLEKASEHASESITLEDIQKGLGNFSWPGRFQIVSKHGSLNRYFLDSAHNEMSMIVAADWFVKTSSASKAQRCLIFAQISDQREGKDVVKVLAERLKAHDIQTVIFTTYEADQGTESTHATQEPSINTSYQEIWHNINPGSTIISRPTITEALSAVEELAKSSQVPTDTLITGSQHLVGGVLRILEHSKSDTA